MKTKAALMKEILEHDSNEAHEAQANLGFDTDWQSLANELKSYTKDDLETLLNEILEVCDCSAATKTQAAAEQPTQYALKFAGQTLALKAWDEVRERGWPGVEQQGDLVIFTKSEFGDPRIDRDAARLYLDKEFKIKSTPIPAEQPAAKQHGGARNGAGRKSRYTTATKRISVNLPPEFIAAIEKQHGSISAALEAVALQAKPELTKLINTTHEE